MFEVSMNAKGTEEINKDAVLDRITNQAEPVGYDEEKTFMLVIRQFLVEISVVGTRFIANKNIGTARRLIWALLICFGLGFAIYQIYQQVRMYFEYPVSVKMNITDMHSLNFPTVTICNENAANRSRVMEYDPTGNLSWAMSESLSPIRLLETEVDNEKLFEILADLNNADWKNIYDILSLDNRKLVVDCNFDGRTCQPYDFLYVHTNVGKCMKFNPYGNLTTEVIGSTNGLQLVLTADVDQYNNPLSPSAGYRVLIHHHSEMIRNDVTKKAVKVDVNHHTQIKVQSEKVVRMPEPYGKCSDEEDYVYSKCSFQCYENYILERCGCGMPSYVTENIAVCPLLIGASCVAVYDRKYIIEKEESTNCDCPQQCSENIYPYQISTGKFSDYFISWMQRVFKSNQYTKEYIEKNLVILDIYYDSLKKTEMITQPAFSLLSLLCDIGGALGLILGSTVLTLFEIIDFCLSNMLENAAFLNSKGRPSKTTM